MLNRIQNKTTAIELFCNENKVVSNEINIIEKRTNKTSLTSKADR